FISRAMKSRWALVGLFFLFLGLTYWTYGKVPQSFVPDEDQGYFLTQVQAPAGASLQYTAGIAQQAEQLFLKDPDVLAVFPVMGAAAQSPLVRQVFTPFTANDPQLVVSVDRQRALASGLPLNEVTTALQTFLGSSYVNDFQFNNRAYRVYVQADARFRSSPRD